MNKISIKAVAIGSVADIVLTNVFMFVLMIYVVSSLISGGVPQQDVEKLLLPTIQGDVGYFLISVTLGCIASVVGGYIAARIAKKHEVLNGLLASFLCVISGIYGLVSGMGEMPFWQHILFLMLSPALAAGGGYLRLLQVRNAQRETTV